MIIAMLVAINIPDTPHPKKSSSKISLQSQHSLTEQGMYHIALEAHHLFYRGSYMSAHVLLNLLNGLGNRDKMRGLPSILSLFPTSLINSIIQEQEC